MTAYDNIEDGQNNNKKKQTNKQKQKQTQTSSNYYLQIYLQGLD